MELIQLAVSIFCLACLVEQGITATYEYTEPNFGDGYRYDRLRIKKLSALGCNFVNEPLTGVTVHQIGEHIIRNKDESENAEIEMNDNDLLAVAYDLKKNQRQIYADEDESILSFDIDDTQLTSKFIYDDELIRYILSNNNGDINFLFDQPLEVQQPKTQAPSTTKAPTTQAPVTTQASVITAALTTTQAPSTTQAPTTTQSPTKNQAVTTTQAPKTTQLPTTTPNP